MAIPAGRITLPPSFDSLIYSYGKHLNSYGDYVKKQTAYVPISNPCVTYRNLFIFQIKK
jgi:hypothetical protein